MGGLTDCDLLFFERLLDGGKLLGRIGLRGGDTVVGQLGQLFVAAGEGLEHVLRILLGGGEGGLLGVELGFQFGHAFGGRLAGGSAGAGRSEFGLGLGNLGVGVSDGRGNFGLSGSDLLGEFVGVDRFGLGFKASATLFKFS